VAFAFSFWFLINAFSEAVNGFLVVFGLGLGVFIGGIVSP
jgi:hypothetical protein